MEVKTVNVTLVISQNVMLHCVAHNLLPGTAHFWSNRETLHNACMHFFTLIKCDYYIFLIVIVENLFVMYFRF